MTQPNFLQVQTSLDRACAFVEAHPDLSSSERYRHRLIEMRERFAQSTGSTDARYTEWRQRLGEERSYYRDIKLECDRVAELADEHGYDDLPAARIVYTDVDQLFPLVESIVGWLNGRREEWSWMAERAALLTRLVAESKERSAKAERLYQQYTVEVQKRVTAYDDAVALLREYFNDAKREASGFGDFGAVQVDRL